MSGRAPPMTGYTSRQELASHIAFAAHLVLRYGDWMLPILDRLEAEMDRISRERSGQDRARLALERYSVSVEPTKAIR